jgi:hypothetical protein
MGLVVVTRRHHRHVRFRQRIVRHRQRKLNPHLSLAGERDRQSRRETLDGGGVARCPGAHRHDHAPQQLDPLVMEQSLSHQLFVLDATQWSEPLGSDHVLQLRQRR